MKKKLLLLSLLSILFFNSNCVKKVERDDPKDDQYITRNDWSDDVKKAINNFIKVNKDSGNKYAVFDFDNTSTIFDIEEQLMIYQIQTMSYAMNPEEFKKAISTGLSYAPEEATGWINDITKAYGYLYTTYGPFSPIGLSTGKQKQIQQDPQWLEFAAKLGCFYQKIADWLTITGSNKWILYMFNGMTDAEAYNLSYSSCKKFSSVNTTSELWESPATIPSILGPVSFNWTSGVSTTDNIKELFEALDNFGIDVWVCSSSGIQQALAAIDAMEIHTHCSGVIAMSLKKDSEGKYLCEYDENGGIGYLSNGKTEWVPNPLVNGAIPLGIGKLVCIVNAISPYYEWEGPAAGFMDSTNDFNFCTEFSSLQLVVCFNRADRPITDGGGLIAEIAMYEKNTLEYDFAKANENGDTFYVLQGRDENGKRSFRNSNSSILLGETTEKLFDSDENYAQLQEIVDNRLTVKQAIDKYSLNFLSYYQGYHSR